jgi:DNA-directed RNA polymerase subunit RPC12/RpoP
MSTFKITRDIHHIKFMARNRSYKTWVAILVCGHEVEILGEQMLSTYKEVACERCANLAEVLLKEREKNTAILT